MFITLNASAERQTGTSRLRLKTEGIKVVVDASKNIPHNVQGRGNT
jgi:hypothetical protein